MNLGKVSEDYLGIPNMPNGESRDKYLERVNDPDYHKHNDSNNFQKIERFDYSDIAGWYSKFKTALSQDTIEDGDIYEFGCWSGKTLKALNLAINKLHRKKVGYKNIHAFDSFEGLPEETEGMYRTPAWCKGNFSSKHLFHTNDTETIKRRIEGISGFEKINFIEGFYEDSLNEETFNNNEFNPAILVHIDVDIYKSTVEVLDFLFKYKIIRKGTILVYDDFGQIAPFDSGLPLYGEKLAHKELCEKYNAKWSMYQNGRSLYQECIITILDYEGCP